MNSVHGVMTLSPVIPVLTIEDASWASAIAEALVAGGLRALEVTLRTPAGLEAIAEMAKVPGAVVGAGTVLNARDVEASVDAGAQFIVSPGLTEPLAKAALASGAPFLSGIATAADLARNPHPGELTGWCHGRRDADAPAMRLMRSAAHTVPSDCHPRRWRHQTAPGLRANIAAIL